MIQRVLTHETAESKATLYQRVADQVEGLIAGGTFAPGKKIPSVRALSRQQSVSISTVLEAYRLLEDRGLIEARPQSGYYVRTRPVTLPAPDKTESCHSASELDMWDMTMRVIEESSQPNLVPFGAAVPHAAFLPTTRLNRILARVVRDNPETSASYDSVPGYEPLRIQVARRSLEAGLSLTPRDYLTTAGNQEGVHLALRAATRPGDTVAIETPTYFGLLQALESLHLKALEIATDPADGICLEDLGEAVARGEVSAVALVANFGNPLGHRMPDDKKRDLVRMLADAEVPLIEDDIYGDLHFEGDRPKAAKAFDEGGGVLYCSSFSKTLAPGYRIGWIAPGRYQPAVQRLKYSQAVATATPTQMAVAEFLAKGGTTATCVGCAGPIVTWCSAWPT